MNYDEFQEGPGDNLLAQIAATADQQKQLQAEVAKCEEALKIAMAELAVIKNKTLPELMDAAGLETLTTTNGAKVKVKTTIRANIPKDRATAAVAWLRENGYGALVKNQVIAEFGLGEDDAAAKIANNLREGGVANVKQNENVNHMTLTAWVNETMTNDPEANLPVELLGILRQRVADVK